MVNNLSASVKQCHYMTPEARVTRGAKLQLDEIEVWEGWVVCADEADWIKFVFFCFFFQFLACTHLAKVFAQ